MFMFNVILLFSIWLSYSLLQRQCTLANIILTLWYKLTLDIEIHGHSYNTE